MERILNIAITGAESLPIPAVHGGDVEVLVEELIKANEENHKFNIDLYTVADPLLDNIKYKYCNIIQLPADEVASFPNKPEEKTSPLGLALNERLKGKEYDFILIEHSMRIYNSIKNSSKMIYHLHCDVDDENFRPKAVAKKIINESYCTLSVSEYTANSMNKIVQSEKNKVLYNCVDFDVFNPDNVDYDFIKEFKEKNNIKEYDFCFIFSGRIHPNKGVLELVTAFKKLREENENVKLIIIGKPDFGKNEETPYTKELKEAKMKFGLTDVVGDGIIITLTDINEMIYDAEDLLELINELRSAGAEAISINDERIVNTSDIVQITSSIIKVNSKNISNPLVIKAIGDKTYLKSALTIKNGYYDVKVKNGYDIEVVEENNIKINKYSKVVDLKYIELN